MAGVSAEDAEGMAGVGAYVNTPGKDAEHMAAAGAEGADAKGAEDVARAGAESAARPTAEAEAAPPPGEAATAEAAPPPGKAAEDPPTEEGEHGIDHNMFGLAPVSPPPGEENGAVAVRPAPRTPPVGPTWLKQVARRSWEISGELARDRICECLMAAEHSEK